jgi:hypothetical protein
LTDDTFEVMTDDTFVLNTSDNITIFFNNFDKLISHHDLIKDFKAEDYNAVIEKYRRRHRRLINDIKTENKLFFIRYGDENNNLIEIFINTVQELNPNLEVHFIHLVYDDSNKIYNYENLINKNYYLLNFHNYVNKYIEYSEDPFYKIMQFNWRPVYMIIYNKLNNEEKERFNYSI